jgi:DNA polymerase-1
MLYHMTFGDQENHHNKRVAILTPAKDFGRDKLEGYYVRPLEKGGVDHRDVIAFNLYHQKGKISAAKGREYLESVYKMIQAVGATTIICTDASYFKLMTKVARPTSTIGYPEKTPLEGVNAFYLPNLGAVFHNPDIANKIELGLDAVVAHLKGEMTAMEQINLEQYVEIAHKPSDVMFKLSKLMEKPYLSIDIETFSLRVGEAGIGTIAFGHGLEYALAFAVDLRPEQDAEFVRRLLKDFLWDFMSKGKRIRMHNATFDAKMLIWELFMKDVDDIGGLRKGLDMFFSVLDDTKMLAYLATNNTSKSELSLKAQAFEFAGNYAHEDIDDITKIPLPELLVYNGVDALATNYVFDKYRDQVLHEQEWVYRELFLPSLKVITMMELTGMPLNLARVLEVDAKLQAIKDEALKNILDRNMIQDFTWKLREDQAEKANAKLKKLRKTKDDFLHFEFNPNSDVQLSKLLYDYLQFPILKTTKNNNPSVSADALEGMLLALPDEDSPDYDAEKTQLLKAIMDLHEVSTILSTFIPAFKEKSLQKKGWTYLLGNFNLGGTVSGRLSSSKPNLQNIPSTGTKYAKIIKECFQAPKGWLFVGADYFSLEDRISALQTKDPNKLAVYTDGYDGHCMRAYAYFKSEMGDITEEIRLNPDKEVEIVNTISDRYKKLRQKSKGPTFALTYMGTWKTLVETFGMSPDEAKAIAENYHELYKVSDQWVHDQLSEAQKTGYVELAFGLRLRTPMLPKVILPDDIMKDYATLPYEAFSEIKTAANALGQSYGLLNSYASNMFMERVWASEYANDILPVAHIHDSQYYMIRNTIGCLKWVNDNLVECMEWCELPAIKHDEVGLGSELEVYWPTWADPIPIPNRISLTDLRKHLDEYQRKAKETV